ncbi:ASCH domain-containing protein [Emticicia sp. 17c]|uniref:ASCH domain-containing protein n=1 Tax=Emticicia sp. 17c TaxID=3127704 RepID=UPI00301E4F81
MKVLLSIKPEYANRIFDGSKKFEFRKSIFKNKNVDKIVVYASSPMQKVIGEFEIKRILLNDLDSLWEKTEKYAGISKAYFDSYFINKKIGYAIEVKSIIKYDEPLCLKNDLQIKTPPQSFMYLKSF